MPENAPRAIRRILLATDLSLESVGAVSMARALSRALGAELRAVHVIEPPTGVMSEAMPGLEEVVRQQAMEELEIFANAHGLHQECRLETRWGNAEHEVIRAVVEHGADLLVVGRFGKGGPKNERMGSVAERLVHPCPVGVVLAAGQFRGPIERIGLACDFSQASQQAARRAVELARSLGVGALELLHACELPVGFHRIMTEEQALSKLEELARERAAELVRAHPGGPAMHLRLAMGAHESAVPELAREQRLDLLVLSSHRGAGGLLEMERGMEKIVHRSPCSVWVEKSPKVYEGLVGLFRKLIDPGSA